MKVQLKGILLLVLIITSAKDSFCQNSNTQNSDDRKISEFLDDRFNEYAEVAHQIWTHAELGYLEQKSSQLLQDKLNEAGFEVEKGVAGIPTAFSASYGSGKPVIGILAEFDALPGVSQDAVPYRKERADCSAGHACGHHLFGTGSTAAGIAISNWLKETGQSGTVKVFGTPAEEGGAGKVYMARKGVFDLVDIMFHWHPFNANSAVAESCLAIKTAKFRFHGVSSHAAEAPEMGLSSSP